MRVRLGCFGALAVACVAAVCAASAPVAGAMIAESACTSIVGSGSSLQSNAQAKVFILGFIDGGWTGLCTSKAPTIEYKATSSGEGLKEFGDEGKLQGATSPLSGSFSAFVGTDVGPEGPATKGTQLGNMDIAGGASGTPNEVVTVPVAQSAVAMIVSLPVGCAPTSLSEEAKIGSQELQETWFSNTKKWPAVIAKSDVTKSTSCEAVPLLRARSKASGTTAGFKRYLSDINSKNWGSFVTTASEAENTTWPLGATKTMTEAGSGGELAAKVYENPNSIGYADLSDAVAKGFTETPQKHKVGSEEFYSFFAQVQTGSKAGGASYEPADTTSKAANCSNAVYKEPSATKLSFNEDWSGAKQTNFASNEESTGFYPICTLTFDVAWHHYETTPLLTKYTETGGFNKSPGEVAHTVGSYLESLTEGSKSQQGLEANQYAALPKEVKKKVEGFVFSEITK